MKTKNLFLTLVIGAMAMGCDSVHQTSAPLHTEADTASFYLGYLNGDGMVQMKMTDLDMKAFVAGMNSALQKKEMKTDQQTMNMYLNNYFQKLTVMRAAENLEKGKKFLAENAKKAGVDTLADGIQYKVIKAGDGPKPQETDIVKVNYKGTLLDGTEFDSSYKRNKPAEFPLNQVIPGWTKSLKEMPVGSKWEIYIPADQAYGQRGGGPIGPNETLIFEVELLEIVNPEADQK